MLRSTKLILIFSLFMMAPYTSALADMSVEKVAKKTKVDYDAQQRILDLRGPKIKSLKHDPYYIRTFADPEIKQVEVHFIIVEYDFFKSNPGRDSGYVMSVESAYKNFYTAEDADGNSFKAVTFHKKFDGCNDSICSFDEYFKIVIPKKYVDDHITTGINLKVISRAGTYLNFNFYPDYIKGMLARLASERKKMGY